MEPPFCMSIAETCPSGGRQDLLPCTGQAGLTSMGNPRNSRVLPKPQPLCNLPGSHTGVGLRIGRLGLCPACCLICCITLPFHLSGLSSLICQLRAARLALLQACNGPAPQSTAHGANELCKLRLKNHPEPWVYYCRLTSSKIWMEGEA